MKILVLEDDEKKKQKLISFLFTINPDINIRDQASYQSGLKAIMAENFDLILLDMSMPTFDISPDEDGWRPQPYAGKKVLRQMARQKIKTPVIVVTQFDRFGEGANQKTLQEINKELERDYSEFYMGAVYYSATQDEWQNQLKLMMSGI